MARKQTLGLRIRGPGAKCIIEVVRKGVLRPLFGHTHTVRDLPALTNLKSSKREGTIRKKSLPSFLLPSIGLFRIQHTTTREAFCIRHKFV
jgi:hypothetical protein